MESKVSILLRGHYVEHVPGGAARRRRPFMPVFRRAETAHRIALLRAGGAEIPVWTLFVTGPKVREWGFLCPKGWRHWRDFTNADDAGATVGKGCAD